MTTNEPREDDTRDDLLEASYAAADVSAGELDHPAWEAARPARLTRYWSGEDAPEGRHAEARLLWSDEALAVRFVCRQTEPLVVSPDPQTERKTLGLWERDVCELFVAPDAWEPERYLELEAAPTGEWVDLMIRQFADERETDWEFRSGMTAAARVSGGTVTIAMRVPFAGIGRTPRHGDRWRANLFRCVGAGPERGYLAWRPTYTDEPGFHVPEAFGRIRFGGQ
ncbi:MAG TPA: carbohydrate-binding family 9-like protein [Pyrinomonadaceae bacterium]|nr:carbohydrate-binding family 9-like protein [Pyrinomonadaceae bacterium]